MDLLISTLSLRFFSNPFSPRRGKGKDEGCSPHPNPLPQGGEGDKKVRGQKPFLGMLFPNPRESSETPGWSFGLHSGASFMAGETEGRLKKFLLKVQDDPEILAVFLFGSAVRGEQRPSSDVDVCLVFAPTVRDRLHMAQKRLEYMSEAPEGLDIQVFQLLPIYIRHRILKEGKVLFSRDEDTLYDVAFATVKAFEDFRHMYREYLDEVARG